MKTFLVTMAALSAGSFLHGAYYSTPNQSRWQDSYQTYDSSSYYSQPSQDYYYSQGYYSQPSQGYSYSSYPTTSSSYYYSQPSYSSSTPSYYSQSTSVPAQSYYAQPSSSYYSQPYQTANQPSLSVTTTQQPAQQGYYYQQGSSLDQRYQDPQYLNQQQTRQMPDSFNKMTQRDQTTTSTTAKDTTRDLSSRDQFTTDADRQLAKKIRDELSGGWFSRGVDNLSLIVDNGNVTVFGESASSDLSSISDKIRNINGVRSVNLQISSSTEPTNPRANAERAQSAGDAYRMNQTERSQNTPDARWNSTNR